MPPLIKSKRAAVSDDAIDWARHFWRDAYKRMDDQIKFAAIRQRADLEHQFGPAMTRIYGIMKSATRMDEELTRLRSLPYTSLEVQELKVGGNSLATRFLVAHTRPIVIMDDGPYDMGPYLVYVPDTFLKQGIADQRMHLIPDRAPDTCYRTPHHVVHGYRNGRIEGVKPWEVMSSTCWGGFGSVVNRINNDGDLVDLLRNIAIYLSRYDKGSVLAQMDSIPHHVKVTRQKAQEILNG